MVSCVESRGRLHGWYTWRKAIMNEIKNTADETHYEKTRQQLHVTGGRRQFFCAFLGCIFTPYFCNYFWWFCTACALGAGRTLGAGQIRNDASQTHKINHTSRHVVTWHAISRRRKRQKAHVSSIAKNHFWRGWTQSPCTQRCTRGRTVLNEKDCHRREENRKKRNKRRRK